MKVTRHKWQEDTPQKLRGSCLDQTETIKNQVESGIAQLYHFQAQNIDIWCVVRFEEYAEGNEMVVMCVGGRGMRDLGGLLITEAKKQNMKTIRYHCQNPAVQRLYERYGFAGKEVERVYKVDLGGQYG